MDIKNLTNLTNEILRRLSEWIGKSSQTLPNGNILNVYDTQKYALQIQTDATYTYIAEALPGTATTSPTWRAKRVVTATGVTTWANGDSNFDNLANSLTTLSYV